MAKKIRNILIVSVILTAVLYLIENVAGFVVGIIPLGMGGDCMQFISLGGNPVTEVFPITTADSPDAGVHTVVEFNAILFAIAFFVRTGLLFLGDKLKDKARLLVSDY